MPFILAKVRLASALMAGSCRLIWRMAADWPAPAAPVSRTRCGILMPLRRAGTVRSAGVRYGPGSAQQREERCSASGTRVMTHLSWDERRVGVLAWRRFLETHECIAPGLFVRFSLP